MKILLVNKFLYPNGGSETYIFKVGECLINMGHEVQYFGMEDERNIVGNHIGAYTSNMNFKTSKLLKLTYPIKIIYSSEARKKIRKVLDDFKPDVVHFNNINFQITPSIIYEIKKDNIPIVWTAHDYQLICPNHMLYRLDTKQVCEQCLGKRYSKCYKNRCIHSSRIKSYLGTLEARVYAKRRTYSYIKKMICPSHFMEKKLLSDPIFEGKTITIHNFIDEVPWKESKKENYALYFGRFSEEKGIATLMKAARQLPNIQFIFAGVGPLEAEIRDVPNIENVGFQTGGSLEKLIREAKFSLYPSEWYENGPFSVMESQMYGTPVIGAEIGGIPELIQDHRTGLLFKSGDIKDLVDKINMLWNDENLLSKLHENCKRIHFDTVKQYCDKLIKIYKNER